MADTRHQRKLAAIVFTDIVGFSRIMHRNEGEALAVLDAQRRLLTPVVNAYGGSVLKEMGDGMLIEFPSSVNAVTCAMEMQSAIERADHAGARPFQIRVGIHLGDVVVSGNDILGDGVNIAARLEPLAGPGGICMTEVVYHSVKSSVSADFQRMDEVVLKNVEGQFTLYEIRPGAETSEGAAENAHGFQPLVRVNVLAVDEDTHLAASLAGLWPMYLFVPAFLFPVLGGGLVEWVIATAVSLAVMVFLIYRRNVRIVFEDVRQVMALLDVLLLRMGYGLVDNRARQLTYVHGPAAWKERKAFAWVRWADSMVVTFDGNTVRLQGPNFHIRRVLGGLKKQSAG